MTRPQMIRADSIDLQIHEAASAKEHNHPSLKAAPNGPFAPHQAETLREVQEERAGEEARSPRVSWTNGDNRSDLQQYAEQLANGIANSLNGNKMQSEDALAIAQNGGVSSSASDDGDMDTDADDGLDDDMDKISSSPSIEDGGCTPPPVWPERVDSLRPFPFPYNPTSFLVLGKARSSSPYPEPAEVPPVQPSDRQASKAPAAILNYHNHRHHHHPGEYAGSTDHADTISESDEPSPLDIESNIARPVEADLDEQEHTISPYDFLIPYQATEEDDDDDNSLTTDPGFLDVGWGGECLQDSEDIDFEFVYALHTFVATVEGQANATKGDTMVLLDDSNSYWWLVRVVKDSSIGYLPAEHIETPTERLARLNKHRNIDLSATMLGDQAEKAKNPIKTAMMRRKTKTVTFTAPTYVDYSDIEYSTEEEDEDGDGEKSSQQQASSQQATADIMEDESAKVEPLKPRSQQKQVKIEPAKAEEGDIPEPTQSEVRRSSDDMFDGKTERTTRNGTVRNTDSFFKDETMETKKITLTPSLLQDDNEPRISSDSKDFQLRQRPSLDRMEKELAPDKKKKEKEKKDKEKKPSAIRSFFSRKDRKKSIDEEDDSIGKRSLDGSADMTEKEAEDAHTANAEASPERTPQRNPSKLQKPQARTEPSPTRKSSISASPIGGAERGPLLASEARTNNVANVPPATLRMVESDQLESQDRSSQKDEKAKPKSAMSKEGRPQKVIKTTSRVELDDFDSADEAETAAGPAKAPLESKSQPSEEIQTRSTLPGAYPDSSPSAQNSMSELGDQAVKSQRPAAEERLSESPVHISPVMSSNPPALMVDTSSQEDRSSPASSPSPELVDVDDRAHGKQDSLTTSTSATTTSTWNDASLRAFFDSGSDIRDLLVIVYDKTDVPPAGPDHPVVGTLFREQNARLAEITTQLDNMLGDWLARKQRLRGTV
ncbi:protein phosphatase regulator [Parahypoxylon ruwenzoriense]